MRLIFEDMPYSALPVYSQDPDMFMTSDLKAVKFTGNEIPPKIEISKEMPLIGISRSKIEEWLKAETSKLTDKFNDSGMKSVIVSLYPIVILLTYGNPEAPALIVTDFCMVAYKDEIEFSSEKN